MTSANKKLILIELNEINFEIVEKYLAVDENTYPSLRKLLLQTRIVTTCEKEYNKLEPWIQWVSVHTNKTYAEHGVFRLGDIVGSGVPQIFEQLEQAGLKVGAISPMNAENRLKNPAYFIPDPWTQTPSDFTFWSKNLSEAISQAVNDNAQSKVTWKTVVQIMLGMLRFSRVKHYDKYLSLILKSRRKPWLKALLLDLLLHDVHWKMFNFAGPQFSTIFLNAGAHIQHHYIFSARPLRNQMPYSNPTWYVPETEDPMEDMLKVYDLIVGEYLERADTEILIATGLSQTPYDRIKYYYRIKHHALFLDNIKIKFSRVVPRMTRDFLVEFNDSKEAKEAEIVLRKIRVEGDDLSLFGEIDNRGKSLFVTLTYAKEIKKDTRYLVDGKANFLLPEVSFVAIKNGMHQENGYAFFSKGVAQYAPQDRSHVAELGTAIINYFGIKKVDNSKK